MKYTTLLCFVWVVAAKPNLQDDPLFQLGQNWSGQVYEDECDDSADSDGDAFNVNEPVDEVLFDDSTTFGDYLNKMTYNVVYGVYVLRVTFHMLWFNATHPWSVLSYHLGDHEQFQADAQLRAEESAKQSERCHNNQQVYWSQLAIKKKVKTTQKDNLKKYKASKNRV